MEAAVAGGGHTGVRDGGTAHGVSCERQPVVLVVVVVGVAAHREGGLGLCCAGVVVLIGSTAHATSNRHTVTGRLVWSRNQLANWPPFPWGGLRPPPGSLTSASIFLKNRSSAASACLLARTIDREVVRGLKAAGPDVSASLRGVGGMGGGCE